MKHEPMTYKASHKCPIKALLATALAALVQDAVDEHFTDKQKDAIYEWLELFAQAAFDGGFEAGQKDMAGLSEEAIAERKEALERRKRENGHYDIARLEDDGGPAHGRTFEDGVLDEVAV